jgi:hypothetical protein
LAEVARGCLSDLDSVALIMLRHFAAILFVIPICKTVIPGRVPSRELTRLAALPEAAS